MATQSLVTWFINHILCPCLITKQSDITFTKLKTEDVIWNLIPHLYDTVIIRVD